MAVDHNDCCAHARYSSSLDRSLPPPPPLRTEEGERIRTPATGGSLGSWPATSRCARTISKWQCCLEERKGQGSNRGDVCFAATESGKGISPERQMGGQGKNVMLRGVDDSTCEVHMTVLLDGYCNMWRWDLPVVVMVAWTSCGVHHWHV